MLITVRNPDGQAAFAAFAVPGSDDAHAEFDALVASPWHSVSYSLRTQEQLATKGAGGYSQSNDPSRAPLVVYDQAMDAARIVIPDGKNNLQNQVRLPLDTGLDAFLLQWDAWYGAEWAYSLTGIDTQKTWQLACGESIWTEVRQRYMMAEIKGQPGDLAYVDVRRYMGSSELTGSVVGNLNFGSASVGGMIAAFAVRPETWTRYRMHVAPRNDMYGWWDLRMWVSDETQAPVQIFDGAGIKPKDVNGWTKFWIEFNTSNAPLPYGRGDLVAYARDVVLLRNPPPALASLQSQPT